MKKIIALALVLVSFVLILCACGKPNSAPVEDFTINSSIYIKATDADYDELKTLVQSRNYKSITVKDGYYICELSQEMYQNTYASAKVNIAYGLEQLAAIVPTIARYRIADDLSTVTIAVYDSKWNHAENGVSDIIDVQNSILNLDIGLIEKTGSNLKLDKYIENVTVEIINFTTNTTVQTITINK